MNIDVTDVKFNIPLDYTTDKRYTVFQYFARDLSRNKYIVIIDALYVDKVAERITTQEVVTPAVKKNFDMLVDEYFKQGEQL